MSKNKSISPPKWAIRFLEWYCKPEYLEEIQGDTEELFERRLVDSTWNAKLMYIWDVLRFFRRSNIKKTRSDSNYITMTTNNFKVASRVLWRQKINTALNVSGIAIGITCFILIGLYVKQEMTFDNWHEKGDRTYRAWVKEVYDDGRVFFNTVTPLPLGFELEKNIPEVEEFVLFDSEQTLVGRGDGRILDDYNIVSANFFDVFDFEILSGNTVDPLKDLFSLVLSESYATKYFGELDPIGETLPLLIGDQIYDFIVTAVVEDPPLNTGFQYTMMASLENRSLFYSDGMMTAWFNIGTEAYVVLKEGTDPNSLKEKTEAMVKSLVDGQSAFGTDKVEDHYLIGFQNLKDIRLESDIPSGAYPKGNAQYVYILGAIGMLVLIIACINYTTLSIGQSMKRAKEVGVRKVVGANKKLLISQYMSESILVAFIAVLLGALLSHFALPIFNELAQTTLKINYNLNYALTMLGLVLFVGLVSGIYPSLVMAKMNATVIMKGSLLKSKGSWTRSGMITFQFLITLFLLSSTFTMSKQLNYLQTNDLGFNSNAMISVPLYADSESRRISQMVASAMANGEILKSELSKNPLLSDFGMGSHVFGSSNWMHLGFNDNSGNYLDFTMEIVDANFLQAFNIQVVEGELFDENQELHKSQGVILNEKAVEYFNLQDPIGKKLPNDKFGDHQIIGVVEDFNFETLKNEVTPLVIVQNPIPIFLGINDFTSGDSMVPKLVFRYGGEKLNDIGPILESVWSEVYPGEELNFYFVEQYLQDQYENEARINKIVSIATILSILIAAFGLLGLTILLVNSKIKEIGIRKVLGASTTTILKILLKKFLPQLLLALCIAVPLTWFMMNSWLESFAYRVNISPDIFLISSISAFGLVFLVIGYHAQRASRLNPTESLRAE